METPPVINSIDDVLPHIKNKPQFAVKTNGPITSIDYIYQDSTMFHTPMERECRGIKFDTNSGKIIGRPFHKFFNVGEREPIEALPWHKKYIFREKLDGSMVHPVLLNDKLVWCTRAGVTDISEMVNTIPLSKEQTECITSMLRNKLMPIFEFCSPENQVVIEHARPRMVLLACRDMITGVYYADPFISAEFPRPDIITKKYSNSSTVPDLDFYREGENQEGFVISFDVYGCPMGFTYESYKLKTLWYLLRHRHAFTWNKEKHMVALIFAPDKDDLIGYMPRNIQEKFKEFEYKYRTQFLMEVNVLYNFLCNNLNASDKMFAENVNRNHRNYSSVLFGARKEFERSIPTSLYEITRQHLEHYVKKLAPNTVKYSLIANTMGLPRWT